MILIKFVTQLLFKAVVLILVFYSAKYVLHHVDWQTAAALYVAAGVAAKSSITFKK